MRMGRDGCGRPQGWEWGRGEGGVVLRWGGVRAGDRTAYGWWVER